MFSNLFPKAAFSLGDSNKSKTKHAGQESKYHEVFAGVSFFTQRPEHKPYEW
jgi:hypothetical protein